jgi:hypothetical protein
MILPSSYISQELPLIKNKMLHFVGAKELGLDTEEEIALLINRLSNLIGLLDIQQLHLAGMNPKEMEDFYNQIYTMLSTFQQMSKKLQILQYFGNQAIQEHFEIVIIKLKSLRKILLAAIEGDLVREVSKFSQSNLLKHLDN